jgi:tRNA A-37 threonylcarbamoyl transferase component Bud32
MTSTVTIDELRAIQYQEQKAFSFSIEGDQKTTFTCTNITRCLPGKRISCQGIWNGKTVFAKLFIAPKRAKKHWQQELKGIEILSKENICTPERLLKGTALNSEIYFVFFAYIENSRPLQVLWDSSTADSQTDLLHQLISTIAEHHSKGVLQKDLHLNNFLLANDQLYTLDGADIIAFDNTDKKVACRNLAQLFAQFYPAIESHISTALNVYFQYRQWPDNPALLNAVITDTLREREIRKQDFIAKTQRDCGLFCVEKTWSQLSIYARKYHSADLLQVLDKPDGFIKSGKTVKKGKSSTVAIVTVGKSQWVIKRYNIKSWRHFLSRALRPSRASISWHNTNLLKFYGIATPEPIAMIEKRFGLIRKTAYFISEFSAGQTYWDFLYLSQPTDTEKKSVAQSVCTLLQSLKRQNISHGDLKISNIMISNGIACLIDLDATQQHSDQKRFLKAHKKDVNRFFKNWENDSINGAYFTKQCFDP